MIPELLVVSAVTVCCLTLLCARNTVVSPALTVSLPQRRMVVTIVLTLALLVRLLFLLRPAELSDDLYRYLWDGLQLIHGNNPYALAPQSAVAPDARSVLLQPLINHPQLVTIYPPAAQLLFAASGGSVIGWKIVLMILDVLTCLILAKLLLRIGRNPWWLSLYALHPLVVLEGAASAHVDISAVFFVMLGVLLADSARKTTARWNGLFALGSAVCLALAVMIKLFPLLFVPFVYLLLSGRQRIVYVVTFVAVCTLSVALFLPDIVNGVVTLRLYACHWEFSGFIFRLLRSVLNSGLQSRFVLLLVFALMVVQTWWRLYRREVDLAVLVQALAPILLLFLLLTPTLHPWYALYLVAFVPLAATTANIVLSWSVLLSYQVVAVYHLSGVWQESSTLSGYIFVAPVAASLLTAGFFLWRRRCHKRG